MALGSAHHRFLAQVCLRGATPARGLGDDVAAQSGVVGWGGRVGGVGERGGGGGALVAAGGGGLWLAVALGIPGKIKMPLDKTYLEYYPSNSSHRLLSFYRAIDVETEISTELYLRTTEVQEKGFLFKLKQPIITVSSQGFSSAVEHTHMQSTSVPSLARGLIWFVRTPI